MKFNHVVKFSKILYQTLWNLLKSVQNDLKLTEKECD